MADLITMPKLGFDMAEGTLVRWLVQEGESIAKGGVIAEIETDKATVEVESAFAGVIAKHLVPEGEVVPVNTPIAVVAAEGEKVDVAALVGGEAPEKVAAPEKVEPPEKPEPSPDQVVAALQDVPVEAGEPVESGEGSPDEVKASPLARRMAEERGIELNTIRGTGPGGRVTKKDIEAHPEAPAEPAPAPAAAAASAMAAPLPPVNLTAAGETQVVPLNRLRAAIGRRMAAAKQQVPHFYVTYEYDMAALMEMRRQVNALLPDNEKTSVNDYILKATSLALRAFPNLNASLGGDKVVRHGQVNVGIAVAVEGGLLTVVCRDTDRKSVTIIANEVRGMVARAREGKVKPADIEGSTFSVSNLGMFDVEHFIAIINPPEAAILAVGAVREVPVVKDGQIVPGMRMKATISVDHRISDGAEAAQFMKTLAKYLEEPLRLMI